MTSADVHSKTAVVLLLIHCLLLLPLFVVICVGPWLIMQYLVLFLICNHLAGEERAGCFTLIVFLVFFPP